MDTKDELLATTALRVYEGEDTILVTFDEEAADLACARHDCISPRKARIDIVPGSMVAEWEAERKVSPMVAKIAEYHCTSILDMFKQVGISPALAKEMTASVADETRQYVRQHAIYPCIVKSPSPVFLSPA